MALRSALTSLPILFCLCLFCVNATTNKTFLRMGQSVGNSDTIVSDSGNYELGFFTRENSTKYYVGVWFTKVPDDKIVWVANRDYAFQTSSAVLTVKSDGNIVIVDGKMTYQVTNISNIDSTYAMLLDSGNLILVNYSNQAVLWQGFDNPTDTLLPGMNLGHDYELGYSWSLRSWTSADDPSPGDFSLEYDFGQASLIINKSSNSKVFWIDDNSNVSIQSVINRIGMEQNIMNYFTWQANSNSRVVLEVSGELNLQYWSEEDKRWVSLQSSKCGTNNSCGAFSICNPQALDPCECLYGFKPFDVDSWRQGISSAGCVRKTELSCSNTSSDTVQGNDGFLQLSKVELPSSSDGVTLKTDTARKCESICSSNCSCVAYVYDFNATCQLWMDQVLILKNISADIYKDNPSFYLRLAASEIVDSNIPNETKPPNAFDKHDNRRRDRLLIVILISFTTLLIISCLITYWARRQRRKGKKGEDLLHFEVGMSMKVRESEFTEANKGAKVNNKEVKLPLFSFVSVSAATDNFSDANKLGEGGFGPVYKGKLLNGDEVAVKRLSRRSGQGWEELRNEALLIAKLQHNNLVRLLGCCIDRDEKMLIYEFMPNKSLDFFLFDATKRRMLDWGTRVRIIDGIAQGLLYLHQYSRFRIIHRDLKASNILLDINMNPKISDFGMARIFGENELQANTNRIVGTYGYMSPEYALEGLFSIKSDVFSFGILLLEIVSGKKNTGFYQTNSLNLLGYAWDLWTSNSGTDMMDPALEDSPSKHIVLRYVNIGLLCVQESPQDRPTMSDVVSMIGNDTKALPCPKPPAFLNVRGNENSRIARRMAENLSVNGMTHSLLEAR
ncbi:receptor-like serine/threonine-protein kinase SD1-7 [Gastrolobium bilobum]|uniref:receptor-like serine/threonine-protein kinase SD1-7 n=1 Tax=Gastrolobium bilobum TaxID=150636 RepID=UPI002AB26063|nr:receptor-like serine/threonine-protein kinase SD1-7 [Gastrolobium bilobum]